MGIFFNRGPEEHDLDWKDGDESVYAPASAMEELALFERFRAGSRIKARKRPLGFENFVNTDPQKAAEYRYPAIVVDNPGDGTLHVKYDDETLHDEALPVGMAELAGSAGWRSALVSGGVTNQNSEERKTSQARAKEYMERLNVASLHTHVKRLACLSALFLVAGPAAVAWGTLQVRAAEEANVRGVAVNTHAQGVYAWRDNTRAGGSGRAQFLKFPATKAELMVIDRMELTQSAGQSGRIPIPFSEGWANIRTRSSGDSMSDLGRSSDDKAETLFYEQLRYEATVELPVAFTSFMAAAGAMSHGKTAGNTKPVRLSLFDTAGTLVVPPFEFVAERWVTVTAANLNCPVGAARGCSEICTKNLGQWDIGLQRCLFHLTVAELSLLVAPTTPYSYDVFTCPSADAVTSNCQNRKMMIRWKVGTGKPGDPAGFHAKAKWNDGELSSPSTMVHTSVEKGGYRVMRPTDREAKGGTFNHTVKVSVRSSSDPYVMSGALTGYNYDFGPPMDIERVVGNSFIFGGFVSLVFPLTFMLLLIGRMKELHAKEGRAGQHAVGVQERVPTETHSGMHAGNRGAAEELHSAMAEAEHLASMMGKGHRPHASNRHQLEEHHGSSLAQLEQHHEQQFAGLPGALRERSAPKRGFGGKVQWAEGEGLMSTYVMPPTEEEKKLLAEQQAARDKVSGTLPARHYEVEVPPGMRDGEQFTVKIRGVSVVVSVPLGATEGDLLNVAAR